MTLLLDAGTADPADAARSPESSGGIVPLRLLGSRPCGSVACFLLIIAVVMIFAHDVRAIFLQEHRTGEEPETEVDQLSALTRAAWALGAALLSHALSSPLCLQVLVL
jgi:hypothetical protein